MSETKHNNYESKDKSGEMRPESEGERQTKVIPISSEGVSEITFIEVNGEKWVKEKQLDFCRTALKKKIEVLRQTGIQPASMNVALFNEGWNNCIDVMLKVIDQTTIEK